MQAVAAHAEHAVQHLGEARRVGAEREEVEAQLPHPPVRRAAPVELELLAVFLDHDPGDVRGRRACRRARRCRAWCARWCPPAPPATGRGSASRSCTHFWASTNAPPAPGSPSGTSATSNASSTGGFSVPSMKPVRSRLSRYTKHGCSAASVGHRRQHRGDRPGDVELDVFAGAVGPHPEVVLRGRRARGRRPRWPRTAPASAGASSGLQPPPERRRRSRPRCSTRRR